MASAAESTFFLGLDVGTQGTKAVLLESPSGEVAAEARASYGLIEGLPPGHAEQHPETWMDAVRSTCRELFSAHKVTVAGIGVSGQQHGFVSLNRQGEVIRPAKLWCDTSTQAEAATLSDTVGRNIPCGFTASKILHMATHEPERFAALDTVLLPHDYINFRLTGELFMEAGDASGTGFFDVASRVFDRRVMDAISPRLHELIPPLRPSGEVAATLSEAGAKTTGLPVGTPVSTGSGDNMMSAIGSGATREGVLILSLGTSGTAFAYSPTPLIDEREWVAPFCDATGGHLPLICVMNMTGVLHEVRELLMPHSMDELTELASRTDAGSNGLLLLPYLGGERTPNIPNATGSLMGIRTNSLRPGPLFRAALEGIALSLGRGVSHMRALGLQVNEVRVVGGGASNSLLCQILADVINAPLRRLITNESAALGAAMHAMAAVLGESAMPQGAVTLSDEIYDPNADLTALYSELSDQLADTTTQLWG